MNYRHAYHAGNFADVIKHAVLARLIEYLKRKDAAFRVIDTHAGTGHYDLSSVEAAKTGEWTHGAGRLVAANLPEPAPALLEPYLAVLRGHLRDGALISYPGSPAIARQLIRRQDRLSLCELHPVDCEVLAARFAGDFQVRVLHLDGWLVSGAHLPPKEKRGLVLIDPPFEEQGEFDRLEEALAKGVRRWPGGIFALWYPLKDEAAVGRFVSNLKAGGIGRLLRTELWVRGPGDGAGFRGSGLIIRNPPFTLAGELEIMLPALAGVLAQDEGAGWRVETLAGE
jgi:23S rRNA (adenine2030-N6)-methyltransferase